MRILFELNQGWGNMCQMVPLYLNLKQEHDVDVCYYREYETDSMMKALWFPCDNEMFEVTERNIADIEKEYEYTIRPPFATKRVHNEHEYIDEVTLSMVETDSEVERYLKIGDYFNVEREMRKDVKYASSPFSGDVVLHNGALNVGKWHYKRYPHMPQLVERLADLGLKTTSIGHTSEYIEGTQDATGTGILQTIGTISNHTHGIFTDTGSSHAAALLVDKETTTFEKGMILYTCTDPAKNFDKRFHKGLTPVFTTLPCQPCQWNYHWGVDWPKCETPFCRNIPIDMIMDMFEWMQRNDW